MVGWSPRPVLAVAVVLSMAIGSLGLVAAFSPELGGVSSAAPSALPGHAAPVSTAAATTTPSAQGLAHALAVEDALRSKGISPGAVHLPNFAGEVSNTHQPIQPSYTQAPAPMGVADIGLENESGVLTPYELNSTTVAGTVNITNLQSLYVDGDGPDTFGIQLNSVLNGVTVFGNSSYEYWCQNYIGYTISTGNLTFGDEVWNFSNPSGNFPANGIYGFANGTYADFPYLYQGFGPSFTIAYPFSLTLYLNASIINDRPAIYFNYTLSNATFRTSASYDDLIFNSSALAPTSAAPTPYYQADGYNYDPIGLINDMEIDILGNDDGDTTAFLAADATVSLQFWNATAGHLEEVPSAYSAGQETGETCVGLLVTSSGGTNPIGIVRNGPGVVEGLWNYSGQVGSVGDTVTVHPVAAYAFLFVNPGTTEDDGTAEWVPTSTTGTTTFYLPTGGTYFLDFLESERAPATQVVTATAPVTLPAVHLAADAALGVYTPLFAFTNGQLAAISTAGAGTAVDPYVIEDNQVGSLAPEFGQWDDYLFPVFPGLLFAGTTAYVDVTPPSFEINLPSWDFSSPMVTALGLPSTNDLQVQFYDASNIALVHAAGISGWLSNFQHGFPESEVMIWDCTDILVASNTFDDEGNGLLLYGGSGNTIWGNTFVPTTVVALNPYSVDAAGALTTAVNETESGDLVYNNFFEVGIPAITPTVDPFPCDQYDICVPTAYTDTWNVTDEPATDSVTVLGFALTGSIIGTSYQGGSYWSNYGTTGNPYGVLPYNNSGAITVAGDYVPLVPFTLYPVTFTETGLATGVTWNVTEGGVFLGSSSTTISVEAPNGTFSLSVVPPGGYAVTGAPPAFQVNGGPVTVDISFGALLPLTVKATGFPSGADIVWSAVVNGTGTGNTPFVQTGSSYPTSEIVFELLAGKYNVSAAAQEYTVSPAYTTVTLALPGADTSFAFSPTPGTLNLTVSPSSASVWVNGKPVTLAFGNASLTVPAGMTSIEATEAGYEPYFSNVTVNSSSVRTVTIALHSIIPGTLSITVSPGTATLRVDGNVDTLSDGAYSAMLAPGVYSLEVTAPGYYTYYNNVTVTSGATSTVPIALHAESSGSSSSGTGGISNTGWAIIAAVAVLAVIFLIGMVYFARRPPKATTSAQPWQESKSGGSPPPSSPPPSN